MKKLIIDTDLGKMELIIKGIKGSHGIKDDSIEIFPVPLGSEPQPLDNQIIIKSSGETYVAEYKDLRSSSKATRQLFTQEIQPFLLKILEQYNPEQISNLTAIQDYINPSIKTLLKEDGYEPQALYHIRKKDLREEIIKQIPEIYKDTESITSKLLVEPPQVTIICVEKDDSKKELYVEWHDKHSGYTSKKVAEGEEVPDYFKEIRAKSAINPYQFDELTIQ